MLSGGFGCEKARNVAVLRHGKDARTKVSLVPRSWFFSFRISACFLEDLFRSPSSAGPSSQRLRFHSSRSSGTSALFSAKRLRAFFRLCVLVSLPGTPRERARKEKRTRLPLSFPSLSMGVLGAFSSPQISKDWRLTSPQLKEDIRTSVYAQAAA
ncbi:hypothetical protein TGDOM2_304690, partial [Toxoplasma gondii GAB2-2007-GAL-DOM2]